MAIPAWRQKQIDDAAFEREQRAVERMGDLMGFGDENAAVGETKRRVDWTTVRLSEHPCPACGSVDRWAHITTFTSPEHNPEIQVSCDCGLGQLRIIVE